MVRIIAFLVGLGFVTALLIGALMPREAAPENVTHEFHKHPKHVSFSSDGPLGTAQLFKTPFHSRRKS